MIKKLIYLGAFILLSVNLLAQHGNEWIVYSQSYFKFPITKDGIYRLSYNELSNAGVPLNSINTPKNFQIYGRGQQLPIYVHNENTGVFSSSDYIEFYAQRNDAWYDSALFKSPDHQANASYSFFTDTAFYYFTWNNSVNNSRLIVNNDVNYSSYVASNYFMFDSRTYFNYYYIEGEKMLVSGSQTSDPEYVNGEGWYDSPIDLGTSRTRYVNTKNVYTAGPSAVTYLEVMGASNYSSATPNHHFRLSVAGITLDSLFSGYTRLQMNMPLSNSALGSVTTGFTMSSINDINSGADRFAIPYLRVVYPHTTNLEGVNEFVMNINDASGQTKSYYNFSNFAGGTNAILYDLDHHIKIKVTQTGTNYQVLIPNSGGLKKCYITGESNIHNVVGLQPVSQNAKFTNYIALNPNADYIIISHSSLMGNSGNLATANDYGLYRNSVGYNSLVVDVEQLYHQFSYGIRKNPLAVRNFIRTLGETYSYSQFRGLFIIGKSYRANDYRKNFSLFNGTLVPTMGTPPSDIQLVSGLVDNLYKPAIPIGRLSAMNLEHVDLYLDKMIMHEDRINNPQDIWMKRIMHFSGGSTAVEQSNFAGYLKNYQKIAEDTSFGANVITIYKNTTDPIQINLSDLIKGYVNNGVTLMTFFGHAAGIGFDISIDNPADYNNYGKYPFLLANSCYAGDIFQYTGAGSVNSSEEFVLIRDKGMIGYLASITEAYSGYLNIYSTNFYRGFSADDYGQSVGSIIQQLIGNIQIDNAGIKEICMEMTLHGDPALKLNPAAKPDFMIEDKSVFYTPEIVSTEVDSFNFNLVISNKGRAISDSLLIEITRSYPNADSVDRYAYLIISPHYRDTLTVKMPVNRAYGVGDNIINIRLDNFNAIDEFDEANNNLTTILNIKAADLSPVYPPMFAIIPNSTVTLKASTYYPFTQTLDYVFEIDTNDYFNSPLKQSRQLQSSGGVLEWTPSLMLSDSVVYYWRVSLDSNAQRNYNWRNSSFQYISGTNGWSQAHFLQFRNNGYQLTKFIEPSRTFSFVDDISLITVQNGIYPHVPWIEIYLRLNNTPLGAWSCISPDVGGLKFYVFDKVSADIWWSQGNGWGYSQFDNLHCTGYNYPCIEFPTSTTDLTSLGLGIVQDSTWFRRAADFLAQIPNGNKVIAMSFGDAHTQNWPEYLYKAFDTIGSNYIRNIQNNLPFIINGEKASLGLANELLGQSDTVLLVMKDSIISQWNEGKITSPVIGPSKKWTSLHWKQHSLDTYPSDSVRLQLIGIKDDGTQQIIIDGLPPDSSDVYSLNTRMDAAIFPYCQLVCYMSDDSLRTPAYVDSWRIAYQPVPEAAIDPLTHFKFHSDTIMQGDTLRLELAYRNLSDIDMDSLLVSAYIKDALGNIHIIGERRLQPLLKNATIIDSLSVSTNNYLGSCLLFIEINPINTQTGVYDQLEVSHLNNIGDIPFFVARDKENPLLDVTFDGIHILNGDIVSAKPEIHISLRDESKFMAINDTALFKIRIKKANDVDYSNIYFSDINNLLEFIPAELPDNSAQVIYRPQLADGEYQLLVYANDASFNKSGDNGFKIDFVIVNKPTITQIMNWPNPFSDKTHFVFTLTGSGLPDYLKIQIITVTGKVVREIDMDELGPLHIGRNITEYAWDGRDEFGDQLANGVYLYRVVTRLSGESIELRESTADQYFKKNFGKMYLMR